MKGRRRRPPSNLEIANRLIEKMARKYDGRFSDIELGDLRGYAGIGAAKALADWDGRGSFEKFAIQRIGWAIVDGLRKWLKGRPDPSAYEQQRAGVAAETAAESIDDTPEEWSMMPDELTERAGWSYRLELSLADEAAQALADPRQDVEHEAQRSEVRRAVARLPPPEDKVLELHVYQHESFGEIAQSLELPKSTVSEAYYRGARRLKKWLAPAAPEPA